MAYEVGDFCGEVEDSESEVSEEERIGEDESAFGIAHVRLQVWVKVQDQCLIVSLRI